jgi:NTE family protein
LLRPPAIPELSALKQAVLRPWQIRPLAAALAVIPPGRVDGAETFDSLAQRSGPSWPEQELWICAVRVSDGRRVVFGRDQTDVPLSTAVAASCAVPGYFKPVQIDGERFVDGVVHSPTNTGVVRDRPLDLILVVSPMSGPGRPIGPYGLARRHAGWLARREVAALRRSGTPVLTFRPGHREQDVMGTDVMSVDRLQEVVQEAFLAAGRFAAAQGLRQLLNGRAA